MKVLARCARLLFAEPRYVASWAATFSLAGVHASLALTAYAALVLQPLPFREPARLLSVSAVGRTGVSDLISPGMYTRLRDRNQVFSGLAAIRTFTTTSEASCDLLLPAGATHLTGALVTSNTFDVLGVTPQIGRGFNAADAESGQGRAVVISDRLWRQVFNANRAILGKSIRLRGARGVDSYEIIGVMPRGFQIYFSSVAMRARPSHDAEDYWLPIRKFDIAPNDVSRMWAQVIARLKPEVSIDAARRSADPLARELMSSQRSVPFGGLRIVSLHDEAVEAIRPVATMFVAGAACLWLVAAVTVLYRMIARQSRRVHELAVSLALGATRSRLVADATIDAAILAGVGVASGVLAATGASALLGRLLPAGTPRADTLPWLDGGVVLVLLSVTAATALVCSQLTMGRVLAGGGVFRHLSSSPFATSAPPGPRRFGQVLAGIGVAGATVLFIYACVSLREYWQQTRVDLGFETTDVLVVGLELTESRYSSDSAKVALGDELLNRLRARGQIAGAAVSSTVPLRSPGFMAQFEVRPGTGDTDRTARIRLISPELLDVLGIRLTQGRGFSARDQVGAAFVALVNRSWSKRYAKGRSPVGTHIRCWAGEEWREVVGVVEDARFGGPLHDEEPAIYLPWRQQPTGRFSVFVRTGFGRPNAEIVQREVARLDSGVPFSGVTTLARLLEQHTSLARFQMFALAGIALVAVALALGGMHAAVSWLAAVRTREFGIRLTVGATPAMLTSMLMAGFWRVVVAGTIAGIGTAWLISPLAGRYAALGRTFPGSVALIAAVLLALGLVANAVVALRYLFRHPSELLRDVRGSETNVK